MVAPEKGLVTDSQTDLTRGLGSSVSQVIREKQISYLASNFPCMVIPAMDKDPGRASSKEIINLERMQGPWTSKIWVLLILREDGIQIFSALSSITCFCAKKWIEIHKVS